MEIKDLERQLTTLYGFLNKSNTKGSFTLEESNLIYLEFMGLKDSITKLLNLNNNLEAQNHNLEKQNKTQVAEIENQLGVTIEESKKYLDGVYNFKESTEEIEDEIDEKIADESWGVIDGRFNGDLDDSDREKFNTST